MHEIDNRCSQLNWKHWLWLLLIILIYLVKALLTFFYAPVAPDAANAYLPMAKKFLQMGSEFLLQQESIVASPVSYLWPALFGGENTIVKSVNFLAGFLMIWLVYATGRNLYSRSAGIIAAALFVVCPLLILWIPTSLSEPPFYLFTLMWIWGLTEVTAGKKWAIPVSALALSFSILTRGVWLYPVIIFIGISLIWFVIKGSTAKRQLYLALACILGLIIPILYIIKNIVVFGLPSIDTGSGGALFFGANIMTNGFEPPLLGLAYEHQPDMRTIKGNAEHASVAIQFLKERSLPELFEWYLTKVYWVVLFSTKDFFDLSVWRIIETGFAITGFIWGVSKRHYLIVAMGFGVVLQVCQTALVLYNIRYSGDNLELLLIPLAAVGVAVVFNLDRQAEAVVAGDAGNNYLGFFNKYALQTVVFIAVMFLLMFLRPAPSINLPAHIPVSILFESKETKEIDNTTSTGLLEWYVPGQVLPSGTSNALWKISMSVASNTGRCHKASLSFATLLAPHAESMIVEFPVHDDGQSHNYLLGTADMNAHLFPADSGKLTLSLDCGNDVEGRVKNIALVGPHFIETYFGKFDQ